MNDYLYSATYDGPLPSGIFLIMDLENERSYLEASPNIAHAVETNFKRLEEGVHPIRDFQYAFDVHGAKSFTVVVLEYSWKKPLRERLPIWISRIGAHSSVYNPI